MQLPVSSFRHITATVEVLKSNGFQNERDSESFNIDKDPDKNNNNNNYKSVLKKIEIYKKSTEYATTETQNDYFTSCS